ncbi:Hypothetical protein DEACI_2386 [Acididesulfobacillus acetoxydans]|uniref:Uncharacterized protein n=1 Tax=Acididesulfobacillus acetoxydans TaxID=1561005 RepID=A0A8S0W3I3_9FIRM|nr:Hypothetical protein DEACI_2386 [Acididesulfobacillus acetoxydans]CEJ09063.1 Hypothetical protein DEACI_3546 [Acididesulfobacillus acetoxydans]
MLLFSQKKTSTDRTSVRRWYFSGSPKGIRTPVSAVRGQRLRPLDHGAKLQPYTIIHESAKNTNPPPHHPASMITPGSRPTAVYGPRHATSNVIPASSSARDRRRSFTSWGTQPPRPCKTLCYTLYSPKAMPANIRYLIISGTFRRLPALGFLFLSIIQSSEFNRLFKTVQASLPTQHTHDFKQTGAHGAPRQGKSGRVNKLPTLDG